MFRVAGAGHLLLIEDGGRPGYLRTGIPESGFADPVSARLANRLVGNHENAAILESLLGGVVLVNEGPGTWVAVTGVEADVAVIPAEGRPCAYSVNTLTYVPPGARLSVTRSRAGVRGYIAFQGGIAAPRTLGSLSRDTLAELGPAPLAAGETVHLCGRPAREPAWIGFAPVAWPPRPGMDTAVQIMLGPRHDQLTQQGLQILLRQSWTVSARGDRIGIRLTGAEPLRFRPGREHVSEGTVRGALEVPPDGFPFVLMADHPVTAGYPVVAVLAGDNATATVAQSLPGCTVRFHL
jgi:biotin-dependent carboxylase-like uncharacterized protein